VNVMVSNNEFGHTLGVPIHPGRALDQWLYTSSNSRATTQRKHYEIINVNSILSGRDACSLEWQKKCYEVYGQLTPIPWPYDEDLSSRDREKDEE